MVIYPPGGEVREFIGNLHLHTWDHSSVPCLYVGNPQGGAVGEFGDVNHPVIEGYYTQYMVADLFATQFKYTQFDTEQCL